MAKIEYRPSTHPLLHCVPCAGKHVQPVVDETCDGMYTGMSWCRRHAIAEGVFRSDKEREHLLRCAEARRRGVMSSVDYDLYWYLVATGALYAGENREIDARVVESLAYDGCDPEELP